MIRVFDNFLPDALFNELREDKPRWRFGAKSNSDTDNFGHWTHKPYHDKKHNLADLTSLIPESAFRRAWIKVQHEKLPSNRLIRAYWNGYTYGTDGYFHTDSIRAGETTAILYIVPEWNADWAGETVVERPDGTYQAVLPHANRLLLFPSEWPHCARAVSRKCEALRSVMVLKSRRPGSAYFEQLSRWLVTNNALDLKHGKHSSLHDHLVRCYELCERVGLPLPICLGAGLHSIYGTNSFKHQLIAPNPKNRKNIMAFFGQIPEFLAFGFSVLDRPKTLAENGPLRLRDGALVTATTAQRLALQLIEAANLIDQGSIDKWPILKEVWNSRLPTVLEPGEWRCDRDSALSLPNRLQT